MTAIPVRIVNRTGQERPVTTRCHPGLRGLTPKLTAHTGFLTTFKRVCPVYEVTRYNRGTRIVLLLGSPEDR
jgi:hypothetical protein